MLKEIEKRLNSLIMPHEPGRSLQAQQYRDDAQFLQAEVKRLEQWIDDLQAGMYINCVYCGHRYPPGTHEVKRQILYDHIKQCPKHPLSKAKAEVKKLREAVEKLKPYALRSHYYCEDCWYTCPKHPEGCCNDALDKNKCNCGADWHNEEVMAIYKALEEK